LAQSQQLPGGLEADLELAAPKVTRQDLLQAALRYAAQGIPVFRLRPDKKPATKHGFKDATTDEKQIRSWWAKHAYGIGMATGKPSLRIVLDIDGPKGEASFSKLEAKYGPLPKTLEVRTEHGRHLWLLWPGVRVQCSNDGRFGEGIDMRGDGGYAVVPPTVYESGKGQYAIVSEAPIAAAPAWLIKLANRKKEKKKPKAGNPACQAAKTAGTPPVDANLLVDRALGEAAKTGRNNAGFWLACQLRDNGFSQSEAVRFMEGYRSQVGPTNTKGAAEPYTWSEAESSLEQAYSASAREPWTASRTSSATHSDDPVTETKTNAPMFSDEDIARRFSQTYGNDLRYTAAWGRWSRWDGKRWERDETLHVFDLSRAVCLDTSQKCTERNIRRRIASAATVAAVERLARCDRRHAATADQWDRDPWLLNTPQGVVDLKTGETRPPSRGDYMTKMARASPGGECADCRRWLAFLERVTDGQRELANFLQRMCGYALTGVTQEHALFFLYGTGANGKSVFLNTVAGILGDYARTAPIETFIATRNEQHPTDIAGLQGARLVTAFETEDGRRWAESKLKALTGGDPVAARFMRQDFFQFTPQFKLLVAGNHKPRLGAVNEAIRRRFNLVPFTITIPEAERDQHLADKLREEWAAILRWMIEGSLAWQSQGLDPPAIVKNATEAYFADEDAIGRWLEDACVVGKNVRGFEHAAL
jgi:putative DNA primase/helicase